MNQKTLYVTDLDGTLLNEHAQVSDYTLRTINKLVSQGMLFTFATGRSLTISKMVTGGLDLRLPVILNNGVFISDYHSGGILRANSMDEGVFRSMLDIIVRDDISALVYSMISGKERVSWIQGRESAGVLNYIKARTPWDERLRPISTREELSEGEVFYVTIIEGFEQAEVIHKAFTKNPDITLMMTRDIYARDEYWVEFYRGGVSKAAAIETLKEMIGAQRVVCFGDGINDLPMFISCDESYAMANAVDELKAVATGVIGSNREDGVAKWLAAQDL